MSTPQLFLICILLAACSAKPENSKSPEESSEAEAAYEESAVEEEAMPDSTSDPYSLADVSCKNGDEIILDNFYQYTPHEAQGIVDEDSFHGNILQLGWQFNRAIRNCSKLDGQNRAAMAWSFFPTGAGEFVQETRDDLLPLIEEQMMVLGEPLVLYAIDNLIPDPNSVQYNNILFQDLYDYYQIEFRKLYFAHILLTRYTSWELQLRNYAAVANTLTIDSEGELNSIYNYDDFINYIDRFQYPEWAYMQNMPVELDDHYRWYCAFWLRRGLDGSSDELLQLQEKVLGIYDPDWLENIQEKLESLPSVSFDLNRVATPVQKESYIPFDRESIPDTIAQKAENGFLISFKNGQSRIYTDGEYSGYSIQGYLPDLNWLVMVEESEYSSSFFLDLADGKTIHCEGVLSSLGFSPNSKSFFANMSSEVGSNMIVYKIEEDNLDKVFASGLLAAERMNWVSNSEIQMKTGYGGNVFIKMKAEEEQTAISDSTAIK